MTLWSPAGGFEFDIDDATGICSAALLAGLVTSVGDEADAAYREALSINQAANIALGEAEDADLPSV